MPVAVQAGGTTAAEPPASTHRRSALHHRNVAEDARGAAVVVVVKGAETKAVLVNSFVGTSDGVAFGKNVGIKDSNGPFETRKKKQIVILYQMLL